MLTRPPEFYLPRHPLDMNGRLSVGYHLLHFLSRQSIPVGVLLLELSNAPTGRSFD